MSKTATRVMAALLLALPSCGISGPEQGQVVLTDGVVEGTGTVRKQNVEGGFYAIRGDDGVIYMPVRESDSAALAHYDRLTEEHPDGIRVAFRGAVVDEHGSVFATMATTISLTFIRPL